MKVTWDVGICVNKPYVNTQLEICNNGVLPATYEVNFNGVGSPLPALCSVPFVPTMPDQFDSNPPTMLYPTPKVGVGPVAPGACITEPFRIFRPPALTTVSVDVACFEAVVKNDATGQVSKLFGPSFKQSKKSSSFYSDPLFYPTRQ